MKPQTKTETIGEGHTFARRDVPGLEPADDSFWTWPRLCVYPALGVMAWFLLPPAALGVLTVCGVVVYVLARSER